MYLLVSRNEAEQLGCRFSGRGRARRPRRPLPGSLASALWDHTFQASTSSKVFELGLLISRVKMSRVMNSTDRMRVTDVMHSHTNIASEIANVCVRVHATGCVYHRYNILSLSYVHTVWDPVCQESSPED